MPFRHVKTKYMTQKTLFPAKNLFKSSKVCMLSQKTARREEEEARQKSRELMHLLSFLLLPLPHIKDKASPLTLFPFTKAFSSRLPLHVLISPWTLEDRIEKIFSKTFSRTFSMAFSSISKLELHSFPEHSLYNAFNLIEERNGTTTRILSFR